MNKLRKLMYRAASSAAQVLIGASALAPVAEGFREYGTRVFDPAAYPLPEPYNFITVGFELATLPLAAVCTVYGARNLKTDLRRIKKYFKKHPAVPPKSHLYYAPQSPQQEISTRGHWEPLGGNSMVWVPEK